MNTVPILLVTPAETGLKHEISISLQYWKLEDVLKYENGLPSPRNHANQLRLPLPATEDSSKSISNIFLATISKQWPNYSADIILASIFKRYLTALLSNRFDDSMAREIAVKSYLEVFRGLRSIIEYLRLEVNLKNLVLSKKGDILTKISTAIVNHSTWSDVSDMYEGYLLRFITEASNVLMNRKRLNLEGGIELVITKFLMAHNLTAMSMLEIMASLASNDITNDGINEVLYRCTTMLPKATKLEGFIVDRCTVDTIYEIENTLQQFL